MKKFALKSITLYGILMIFIAVGLLPIIKGIAPQYFPGYANFTDLDCRGVTCPEGQFCGQNKQCFNIATRYPDNVPIGNM
jgi:hypothetical protein